jgi:lipopolysaccharide export system protein LptA
MSDMRRKIRTVWLIAFLLSAAAGSPLLAQESTDTEITFSSRYTRASMRGGQKSLILSQDAWVETGDTRIEADEIEAYGEQSRFLSCTGNVNITQETDSLRLTAQQLLYDRIDEVLTIRGWAQMEDIEREIIVHGSYLEHNQRTGITLIQVHVRISKDTEDGPMICLTDSAVYDSENQILEMTGDSSVYWNTSTYRAARITVDLQTNEIELEGSVRGTISQ